VSGWIGRALFLAIPAVACLVCSFVIGGGRDGGGGGLSGPLERPADPVRAGAVAVAAPSATGGGGAGAGAGGEAAVPCCASRVDCVRGERVR